MLNLFGCTCTSEAWPCCWPVYKNKCNKDPNSRITLANLRQQVPRCFGLYFCKLPDLPRGSAYSSRFCPQYKETAPVKITPARVDVPKGLFQRRGRSRGPVAAPSRPQVRLAVTKAAGQGLNKLHVCRYALKLQGQMLDAN